ncbi:glycosyltransferase family 2 protein [Parabacteroides bouchesdurhonensis]|uniref:glycosyltransferase family 2 protein n=1 Tax=Parabacteroides bouchesdurhonensis TaxID=1936995 RepID=UPI00131BED30|nr:glycosyltransferase family 2 protein [Parabacteroides bouchesdurhonensis]
MNTVSFIVPVYNRAHCIRKCLDSILNQTCLDWECVIVDDGSTDNTWNICTEYAGKDDRFIVYRQENKGVSAARNKALDLAKGQYVAFVDSDDYIELDFLEKLMQNVTGNIMPVACLSLDQKSLYSFFSSEQKLKLRDGNERAFAELAETGLLYGPVAKIYDRSILENNHIRFHTDVSYGEDVIFNFTYLQYISEIHVIPERLYNVIQTSDSSVMHPEKQSFESHLLRWEAIYRFFCVKNMKTGLSEYLNGAYYGVIWLGLYAVLYKHKELSAISRYRYIKNIAKSRKKRPMEGAGFDFPAWKRFLINHPFLYWLLSELKYMMRK